jgi:putative DNA methylase
MFGGGGTIGFEAASLGADVCSLDSNELSVFLQKSILSLSAGAVRSRVLRQLKESGTRILRRLEVKTSPLFPSRKVTFSYLWTYKATCEHCGLGFHLSKRPWLSKKNGKRLALICVRNAAGEQLRIEEVPDDFSAPSAWVGRSRSAQCPACQRTKDNISIRDCEDCLVAVVGPGITGGKRFSDDLSGMVPPNELVQSLERDALAALDSQLPSSVLPKWSGIVNPSLYGIETHAEFLNGRQRAVLLLLIESLRVEFEQLQAQCGREVAVATTSLLSGLIDQVIDWNCRLSMWIPQNEQVGRAFCGPGVAMLWDYAETDPVGEGPGNLWKKLDRIIAGCKACSCLERACDVRHGYAQDLPFDNDSFDAIVTDPPYYDNIYYTVLSDFFFSWKRLLFRAIEPNLFRNASTDSSHELVASAYRAGQPGEAHADYCSEFAKAIREAERVLRPEGVFSLLYSHSSIGGWEAIVRAYRDSGLWITGVQPLSIERKQRPRAMTSEATNTCVVFVAHRSGQKKQRRPLQTMCAELEELSRPFIGSLKDAGWHERDIGLACYAQGVGMLANTAGVAAGLSDMDALRAFGNLVHKLIPEFRLIERRSL